MKLTNLLGKGVSGLLIALCLTTNYGLAGEGRKVVASGKTDFALESLPKEVANLVKKTRPTLTITEAEYETRDGREYYDVGGVMPNGSEIELDMTLVDGAWTVVEIQRDINLVTVPVAVKKELASKHKNWTPSRIIESDQGDGVVIYEFFGPDKKGTQKKVEVKYQNQIAEILLDEWLH